MKHPKYLDRQTKIVATIGPATGSALMIERLIKAGMNCARSNLSHGTFADHAHYIGTVRKIGQRLANPVAILVDLPGPKYRTGDIKGGSATLRKGARFTLTTRQIEGNDTMVSVNYPNLTQDIKVGDTVLIDDGALQLKVQKTSDTEIECRIVAGGVLTHGKGVAVPGMHNSVPFMTDHLREQIGFAVEERADYIALSFVSSADDVVQARAVLAQKKSDIPLIAKIERDEAVSNFASILMASDGIMVARGDLGVDIPLEKVPLVQKQLIKECNRAGKPVITATQMLESMINSARPTRAEVTDVANAIFDGTDAVMLSAETAIGKYPVEAIKMMAQVARETEKELPLEHLLIERGREVKPQTDEMISYDACHTAHELGAVAIVAFTHSGSTARRVSKYRPKIPVLAITPQPHVGGRLLLCWGVHPFQIAVTPSLTELFNTGARLAMQMGLARSGDLIVITGGIPIGVSGTTNLLKVERCP
jgi:pyruvate kinase